MNNVVLFLPFVIIMGGMMFLQSRRQRRAMQTTIDLHASLRPGDRVYTTSGLQATVAALTEDTVDLEIAPGVVTTWLKLAIRDKIVDDPDDPDDHDDHDDLDSHNDVDDHDGVDGGDGSRVIHDS